MGMTALGGEQWLCALVGAPKQIRSSSGFTSSLVGTQGSWQLLMGPPVEFSWGDSSLAGMVREASVLLQGVVRTLANVRLGTSQSPLPLLRTEPPGEWSRLHKWGVGHPEATLLFRPVPQSAY